MTISVPINGPQLGAERTTLPQGSLGLTVTGVDPKGHMFREPTSTMSLDGRDCKYQSKHEVQVDSCVLLDIDYTKAGQKPCRVQGQVKSVQPPRAGQELFQIGVELEAAQNVRVVPNDQEDRYRLQETSALKPHAARTEPIATGESARPSRAPAPQTEASARTVSEPSTDQSAAVMAQSPEVMTRIQTQVLTMAREAAKSAVVTEISQHLGALRNSLPREVEKAVQAAVGSGMERMIGDAVEKQIAQQYQAAIQALNSDLIDHLVGQLAESEQLRTSFETMTKSLAERLSELSQTAATKTEQDLNARVTVIRQSIEETIARVQETLEQLRDADRIATQKVDERLLAQLDIWSAEFNKRLDRVVVERAARFISDVQQQLIPYLQRADETRENLTAGLQLAQGSLRMQQERLAELSRTAAANFEKDIKALFLRLSGNA